MIRRAAVFALTLLPLVPGVASAQATSDGAAALERQIHDWIVNIVGPNASLSQRPVQVTASGDHYDLSVPIGSGPNAPAWTAAAREQSGGRYAVDNIRIPSPAEFHIKLPDAVTAGGPPGMSGDLHYKLTIGQQAAQMLLDPTFATTTTTTSSMQNLDVQTVGNLSTNTTHIDRGTSTFVLQPAANGRLDLSSDGTLEGYRTTADMPNANGWLKMSAGSAKVKVEMTGVSRERAVEVIQGVLALVNAASQATAGSAPPDKLVEPVLAAIGDLASGMSLDESIQDLAVNVQDMDIRMHNAQFGFALKGAGGLLQGRLDLGAEGLTLPDLGLGSMAELIPTKVTLRPTVTGLPAAPILKLIQSSKNQGDPSPEDIMALFARGPITAGLENLVVAVAGAEFTGLGKVELTSPQDFSGTAQFTATNLDLLQQRLAAEPTLAQAAPAIIFLKGIGRASGNQMIWDVSYRGGRLLVNNQDLSSLVGGAAAPTPPPATPPATRQRPATPGDHPQLRRRQN